MIRGMSEDVAARPESQPEILVTIPEAARRYLPKGIPERQLQWAVRHGHVPHYRIGAWKRLDPRDVLTWVMSLRVN